MGRIPPEGCDAESDHGRSHDGSGSGLPPEIPRWLDSWLETPIKKHIARWKYEMAEGLRDENGRWVGGLRRRRWSG